MSPVSPPQSHCLPMPVSPSSHQVKVSLAWSRCCSKLHSHSLLEASLPYTLGVHKPI